MRGLVARQLGRALERNVAAERAAGSGDVVGVGGEDESVQRAGVTCRFDGVREQRLPRERFEILSGKAL
jgi:hypothetical protein